MINLSVINNELKSSTKDALNQKEINKTVSIIKELKSFVLFSGKENFLTIVLENDFKKHVNLGYGTFGFFRRFLLLDSCFLQSST